LITIDTPHWGSDLANISNITGVDHKICDHDLDLNSAMYGETDDESLNCIWESGENCPRGYTLTSELQYNNNRTTKYYAIAGIDYDLAGTDSSNYPFDLPTNCDTYAQLSAAVHSETNNLIAIKLVNDNLVGFLSQIGWTADGIFTPSKKIQFEKIFVNIDANGGNSLSNGNHFHEKMVHRQPVMEKVYEFLSE